MMYVGRYDHCATGCVARNSVPKNSVVPLPSTRTVRIESFGNSSRHFLYSFWVSMRFSLESNVNFLLLRVRAPFSVSISIILYETTPPPRALTFPSPGLLSHCRAFSPSPTISWPAVNMTVTAIRLSELHTRADLAAAICVPVPALDSVSLASTACKRTGCLLSSVQNNNGWCLLCSQTWFPRELDKDGQPGKFRRGYGLYGNQFLRNFRGKVHPCCCSSPLCEKLGYSHHGMFRFPSNPADVTEAARVLGIPASKRLRIIDNLRKFRLAPWHFHSRHRVCDDQGRWRLRKEKIYRDADGKTFSFAPPNGNIQQYIDEEVLSSGLARGAHDNSLPAWVRTLSRQQRDVEGPVHAPAPPRASTTPPPRLPRKR